MTESGFWVGPPADPHRLRLTHLLGSGGEGEVWRARDRAGAEYAVKMSPADTDGDEAWETRVTTLLSLDVPGLVRVRDVFAGPERHRFDEVPPQQGTRRYVVLDFVEGLTLRQWLDEGPGRPARERVALLRKVARTVDALHVGQVGQTSFTHGDIKPTNIIVRPDGEPVLVDLGLARETGEAPVSGRSSAYSSPELRSPGARPTRQTDTFAFAVTAMETMTGAQPPLDAEGFPDIARVRELVRHNRALRRRPVLRHQLLRGLSTSPERRPHRVGVIFTVGRRVLAAGTVTVVVLSGGAAAAMHARPDRQPTATTSAVPAPVVSPSVQVDAPKVSAPTTSPTSQSHRAASPTATAIAGATEAPVKTVTASGDALLKVLTDRSLNPGAMHLFRRTSLLNLSTKPGDYVANQTDGWGPSSWSFSMSSKQELHVVSVEFRRKDTAPPRDGLVAVYDVGGAYPVVSPPAHGHPPPKHKPEFKSSAAYTWDMASSRPARETDGDPRTLAVLPTKPGAIYLDSTACSGNYQFWVKVSFAVPDQPNVLYVTEKGPFLQYASARDMPFVSALDGNNTFLTNLLDHVSGHPAGCQGPAATPYASPDTAIHHLLAKYTAEVARKGPDLTRSQVLDLVSGAVAPKYTAADVATICDQAAAEHWRYQCWP